VHSAVADAVSRLTRDEMSDGLPRSLSALLRPAAYPHPVDAIELIRTPVSWVLLTGEFAYKLKRPVRYPFIDLTRAERREFCCREELRLNRRFAPQLYFDVCAITTTAGEARIGGDGTAIEYAVKMRQFRREDELDRLLASGEVAPGELGIFGGALAGIHARLPTAAATDPWATADQVGRLVLENLAQCAQAADIFSDVASIEALRAPLQKRLGSLQQCMAARRTAGRVRECHGDLHTCNVVRWRSTLLAFDCMEFEPAFRWIDVADEIAFLLADLGARGYPDHAHSFLAGYLAASGDYQACRLLPMYQAHRALVRAKITAVSARESGPANRARQLQEWRRLTGLAAAALTVHRPRLLLTCGTSGSGKTWLADRLAPRLRAIHLRSDVERKRRVGLPPAARLSAEPAQGVYTPESTAAVYADLLAQAEDLLAGGRDAIVDATFGRREQRERFLERARQMGACCLIIVCLAPVEVLHTRVAARCLAGGDASDADQAVLRWQLARHETLDAAELARAVYANTDEPGVIEDVMRQVAHLEASV